MLNNQTYKYLMSTGRHSNMTGVNRTFGVDKIDHLGEYKIKSMSVAHLSLIPSTRYGVPRRSEADSSHTFHARGIINQRSTKGDWCCCFLHPRYYFNNTNINSRPLSLISCIHFTFLEKDENISPSQIYYRCSYMRGRLQVCLWKQ
jgi:hypothetical protein